MMMSSIPAKKNRTIGKRFLSRQTRSKAAQRKPLSEVESLIAGVGKAVQQVTTDDLRRYLTNYQVQRRSSKVTIDNIRRILSSFFSWLEDFIVKVPDLSRIHKVKTAKVRTPTPMKRWS